MEGIPADVLPMRAAEMDYPVCRPVAAVLERAVAAGFGYPSPVVAGELADTAAEWQLQRHGWAVDPADVHVVADVMAGVRLAIDHLTSRPTPWSSRTVYMPFFDVVARPAGPR